MSLNTPQNERVAEPRAAIIRAAATLEATYVLGADAMFAEDWLDDAILAYVKARNAQ